jgi:VanZ family protein
LSTAQSASWPEGAAAPPPQPGALRRWIPVALWAACISWFSTDAFSAQSTNRYIDPALRALFGELSPQAFRFAHAIIRKSAHFLEYAVLAILMCRALTAPGTRASARVVVRALVYCALYACADELHQFFVPSRTASPSDIAVDTVGASVGVLVFAAVRGARRGGASVGISARSRGSASRPSGA